MGMRNSDALIKKMNIRGSYIIGNQCDRNEVVKTEKGLIVSTDMRGVGQNRNTIIERSVADVCVLADDDMIFCDDYEKIVQNAFDNNPSADVLIFNFIQNSDGRRVNKTTKKVGFCNYMNYGAARIAFRRKSIAYNAIFFNTMFGGGTPYQCGEDTLFLNACLKTGLKIIAVPDAVASLSTDRDSTWFHGYTEKYFYDKGALFSAMNIRLGLLLCCAVLIKNRKEVLTGSISLKKAIKLIKAGYNGYKKRIPFYEDEKVERKH